MAEEVPRQKTPVTSGQLAPVLAQVFQSFSGFLPNADQLAVLLGQWDLETGGGIATFNFNLGNVKHTKEPFFFVHPEVTTESNHFAAFSTLEEGARRWLSVVAKQANFASAWAALLAGSAQGYAEGVQAGGYAGNPNVPPASGYARAILSRMQKYVGQLAPIVPKVPTLPVPKVPDVKALPWGLFAVVGGAGALGAGFVVSFLRRKK